MMLITPVQTTPRHSVRARFRPWWLWIATAFAFPPAGLIAHQVAGPVDGVGAASLNGVVAGTVIGTAQWLVLRRRGCSLSWIVATAAGLAVGLAAGAALVDYSTSIIALVAMGAVCGAAVGLVQAVACSQLRRSALVWTVGSAALWAIGWAVAAAVLGVNVDDQWPVFGISGALVVAISQSVLVNRLLPAPASTREAATNE